MPVEFENSSAMTASGETSVSSGGNQDPTPPPPLLTPVKKRRNLPGMPDPDAEVIALSPKTLMATNRFVCEICNKGFQRDQNLQLHRRGHNLPWKLRQRTAGMEVRKRVYVCPEPSCVHHEPSRALGDLTGIKKHFCRKHGEKKWKCDKCSKKYAVQSDWKAHSKTCGTREYRCDCGTLFCRRDSFITHRAFCDTLAEESYKASNAKRNEAAESKAAVAAISMAVVEAAPDIPTQSFQPPESEEPDNSMLEYIPPPIATSTSSNSSPSSNTATLFASLFSSATASAQISTSYTDLIGSINRTEPMSLCLSTNAQPNPSLFASTPPPTPSPHLSATALLQKAAQMGAAATTSSFLKGLGLSTSNSNSNSNTTHENYQQDVGMNWAPHHQNLEHAGLGLGLLPYDNMMLGSPSTSLFGVSRPTTLDLLGLGIGPRGSATSGLSALMSSINGGGLDGPSVGPGSPWEGADRKSNSSAVL